MAMPIIIGSVVGLLLLGTAIGIWYATKKKPVAKPTETETEIAANNPKPAEEIPPGNNFLSRPIANKPAPSQPGNQVVWKQPIRANTAGGDGLPLKELKAASVFIRGIAGDRGATGSGFVVAGEGTTAYIVTNHHVITDSKTAMFKPDPSATLVLAPPFRPGMPGRPVIVPKRPFGPGVGPGAIEPEGTGLPYPDITVVFRSGTSEEQSVKAAVIADNSEDDLAILKVMGVRDIPSPIDCSHPPKLVETMPVLAFGFPFGSALDKNRTNPAITVTKGAVTSIREGKQGELDTVQIDADLNAGNSGGPVVDETGVLVGVSVAKIKNSRIGFAVPAHKLDKLLRGAAK